MSRDSSSLTEFASDSDGQIIIPRDRFDRVVARTAIEPVVRNVRNLRSAAAFGQGSQELRWLTARKFHDYVGNPGGPLDRQEWQRNMRKPWAAAEIDGSEKEEDINWMPHAVPNADAPRKKFHEYDRFLNEPMLWADHHSQWKGIQILGGGGQGVVGLFEHSSGKRVAVKKSLEDRLPQSMLREARMMKVLSSGNPPPLHIVRMLHNPEELVGPAGVYPNNVDYYDTSWDDLELEGERAIETIVMEHCEHGDLESRIIRQIKKGNKILESHLWSIFKCLLNGITVLDRGHEDPLIDKKAEWTHQPIVHFDYKPLNIFLATKDDDHPQYIYKLGDFGLAVEMIPAMEQYKRSLRTPGTRGWYTPEQFTTRWDASDWKTSPVAGKYGTPTNVWNMGAVMYQLCTLSAPPQPVPFKPQTNDYIRDRIKEPTFGRGLGATPYSEELKCTIWECLYEIPASRPTLKSLMESVTKFYDAVLKEERAGRGTVIIHGPNEGDDLNLEPQVTAVETFWGGNPNRPGADPAPIQSVSGSQNASGLNSVYNDSTSQVPDSSSVVNFDTLEDDEPEDAGAGNKLEVFPSPLKRKRRRIYDEGEDDYIPPSSQRRR